MELETNAPPQQEGHHASMAPHADAEEATAQGPDHSGALVAELRRRIADLEISALSRPEIDQAIGMIMLARRCGEAAALEQMKQTSQDANVRVRDIAAAMAQVVDPDLEQHSGPAREVALQLLLPQHTAGDTPEQ